MKLESVQGIKNVFNRRVTVSRTKGGSIGIGVVLDPNNEHHKSICARIIQLGVFALDEKDCDASKPFLVIQKTATEEEAEEKKTTTRRRTTKKTEDS